MVSDPVQAWRDGGALWDFRGRSIFFRDSGSDDKPVLLLIHGFPTSSYDWEAVWPRLAASYRVIAPDMLGFGFSDKPAPYAYRIMEQADLMEALLRHCGIGSYAALAHDYGDTVAQELLARQGEGGDRPRLQGLALLNGGLFPETHRPLFLQRVLLSRLGFLVARLTSRSSLERAFRRIFGAATPPDDAFIDASWRLLTHNDGRRALPGLIHYMTDRRVHRERWVGALQKATIPVTVIAGADDPVSGRHMVDRYRELIPQPDTTLLEGIGHYPQVEAPDRVLSAFEEWLRHSGESRNPACVDPGFRRDDAV
jgi:pimeloyl-ACP methyl ester carboxylesterase